MASSISALIGDIVHDTRDLAGAHVEQIRRESKESVEDLGERLKAGALAAAAMVVTLVAVCHALAITMVALGVPAYFAYWIVAALATGIALLMRARAKRIAENRRGQPVAALERAKADAKDLID